MFVTNQQSRIKSQGSPSHAFTLIELLVVIAIISILAAILFPVFASAKNAAKKTTSISNLKQINLAWMMYNDDYDDTCMRTSTYDGVKRYYWWGSFDGVTFRGNEGLLYPYTKSKGLRTDPAFDQGLAGITEKTGYGYNHAYLSPTDYPAPLYTETPVARSMSSITTPVETLSFATSASMNFLDGTTLEGNSQIDPPSWDYPCVQARFNGFAIIAWCDGHVKAMRPLYRTTTFNYYGNYNPAPFKAANLGDLDKDGDFTTDEYYDLQ